RYARAEISDCRIALPPRAMLEEFHPMVAVDHHDRVLGAPARIEMGEQGSQLGVEPGDTPVVQVDDLLQVELLLRVALAPYDIEWVVQPRHRELGFAPVMRRYVGFPIGRFGGERRVSRGEEHVQQEWLAARRQAA